VTENWSTADCLDINSPAEGVVQLALGESSNASCTETGDISVTLEILDPDLQRLH